jgi:hypothetical protein
MAWTSLHRQHILVTVSGILPLVRVRCLFLTYDSSSPPRLKSPSFALLRRPLSQRLITPEARQPLAESLGLTCFFQEGGLGYEKASSFCHPCASFGSLFTESSNSKNGTRTLLRCLCKVLFVRLLAIVVLRGLFDWVCYKIGSFSIDYCRRNLSCACSLIDRTPLA